MHRIDIHTSFGQEASEKKAQARSQQGQSTPGARLGLGGLPIAQPTAPRPAPLRIDDQGREIDADGKVIERLKPQIFKVNSLLICGLITPCFA